MNYWILQSNPAKFRIMDWIKDYNWLGEPPLIDCWHINYFVNQIRENDIVYIWKSKGNDKFRGIFAKGMIVPNPVKFPLAGIEHNYFLDKNEMQRLNYSKTIALKYIKLYIDKPLLEDDIKNIPLLTEMTILVNQRRGIHKLTLVDVCRK